MSEHTKGPWAVNYTKFSEVRAENGAVIARCLKLTSLTNLEANARRIVACVNACEGVRTEHLGLMPHLAPSESSHQHEKPLIKPTSTRIEQSP